MFWCSILFQLNLNNLRPVTALISTAEKPSSVGPKATVIVNHTATIQSLWQVQTKILWKWPCIISTCRDVLWSEVISCSSLSDKISNWSKTTGKTEMCKYYFSWMRIYMLIYLVWIIMFNSWYKHGVGKTDLKILNFPWCGGAVASVVTTLVQWLYLMISSGD